jgi:hypothetical protein
MQKTHACSLFDDEAKLLPIENNTFLSQKSKINPTLKYYQRQNKFHIKIFIYFKSVGILL